MKKNSTVFYVISKLLAFLFIYVVGTILQQIIVTAAFLIVGYDPMHGILPEEHIQMLTLYYGYSVYIVLIVIYCKVVEKRLVHSLGCKEKIKEYLPGAGIAVAVVSIIMCICCITGGITFEKINKNVDYEYQIFLLGGLMIQGAVEEFMCRGFLQTSLMKRTSIPTAVFWSATVFALPHLENLLGEDILYVIIGIVNLYLVSIIFSLLVLCQKNIWVACGLHSVWNFLLYGVFGLTLSGNTTRQQGMICFTIEEYNILNGGIYGIETSIITTMILGIVVMILYLMWKKEGMEYGI